MELDRPIEGTWLWPLGWVAWFASGCGFIFGAAQMIGNGREDPAAIALIVLALLALQIVSFARYYRYRTTRYVGLMLLTLVWSIAFCLDSYGLVPIELYSVLTISYVAAMFFIAGSQSSLTPR